MPRITAFQCRWTKKVFTDREKYLKHLKLQREALVIERKATRINRVMQETFLKMRDDCESMADIEQFIRDNWSVFYQNAVNNDHWRGRKKKSKTPELLRISIRGRFSDNISNSHSAPIGKAQNWGRKPGIPTGYPGWQGEIQWELDGEIPGFGSDVMQGTGINTGSGGGRGNGYGFEMKLFMDDWPGLARAQAIEKLSRSDDLNPYW